MVTRLVLVLGDQLSRDLSALREADKARDVVVMAEVAQEAEYVRHHPKKIALVFAAMRKFARALEEDGWNLRYTPLDDPENAGSIVGELLRRADETGAGDVIATEPGEWRLIEKLNHAPIPTHILPDDRFIASRKRFEDWAEGRKALRMEYFYREMRRETGLLMEGGDPAGGKWNFDHDNRKPPKEGLDFPAPLTFTADADTQAVLELVAKHYGDNFGDLEPFDLATTREEALQALSHFITHALPRFGDYQDAMMQDQPYLFHALISPYMNLGLLNPMEVCRAAEKAWQDGDVPINAAEGFMRQILGWREYVRGIYFLEGPDYAERNALRHDRDLPDFYWGAQTHMNCVAQAVDQTKRYAYAHHIQRLMVTGNFALLAGVDPHQVHEWYLEVYADAYEWVEAPNTVGMSQFADGGVIASKPYVSSGAYINRMSDYCKGCTYGLSSQTSLLPVDNLIQLRQFLDRHRDRFQANMRMKNIYASWDRMDADRRETVLREAGQWLARLDAGETV